MPPTLDGWQSIQRRTADGATESEQRMQVPQPVVELSEQGGRFLGRRYWDEVSRVGRGLLRCRQSAAGVELRLLGRGPRLLVLGAAEVAVEDDRVSCRYPICGGLLARRPGGALTLSQNGRERPELSTAVAGFFPRLGPRPGLPMWTGAPYEQIQRRLHVAISRRYFNRLVLGERR